MSTAARNIGSIVQAEEAARATEANLAQIYVRSRTGDAGAAVQPGPRPRFGRRARPRPLQQAARDHPLAAASRPAIRSARRSTFLEAAAAAAPEVVAVGYRGESQAFREAGGSIYLVFVLTILVVYLLLAAQFESFVHPGVIITTVPLAVAGGLIGLAVMGQTMNLYSQVGLVMLVGLAAKNGILIVEFANQLRDAGRDIGTAIREAARRRLRPILMTSIATVAGAVPLMLAERRRRGGADRDRRGDRVRRLDRDGDHPVPDPARFIRGWRASPARRWR